MTGKDLLGAEDLLDQHGAYQQMGPGGGAEGQDQIGTGDQGRREAFGAADQKDDLPAAPVAQRAEPTGEVRARQASSGGVERDDIGPRGTARGEQLGLAPDRLRGGSAPASLDLPQLDVPPDTVPGSARRGSSPARSLNRPGEAIVSRIEARAASGQPPARDGRPSRSSATPHIFSML